MSNNKSFVSSLTFLILVNLLVKPFYIFGIDRNVQLAVGTESFGLFFALLNLTLLIDIVLDLGLTSYNSRTIAQDRTLLAAYVPNFIVAKLILALFYFILVYIIAWISGYDEVALRLLFPLIFSHIFISFNKYMRSNVAAFHYFKMDALLSISNRILMILICSVLLWGGVVTVFKIEYFAYAEVISTGTTLLISLPIIAKMDGFQSFKIKKDLIIKIIKEGYPYALLVLLMMLYNRIDGVMLERMLPTPKENGIYAASYRLLDAGNNFALLFGVILLPTFSRKLKLQESIATLTKTSFHIILVFSATTAICCWFYKTELMYLLYPNQATAYWGEVFGWLILSFIPLSSIYIFCTLLTANGNLRRLNIIAICGFLFNLGLNYLLIPKHGAIGATIATLCTQILVATSYILGAIQFLKLKPKIYHFYPIGAFLILTVLFNYLTVQFIDNWLLGFLMGLILAILSAFITKTLSLNYLFDFIKLKK